MEPLLLTVEDAAKVLSVSGVTIRRMIRSGELKHVKVGRSVRVTADTLRNFVTDGGAA